MKDVHSFKNHITEIPKTAIDIYRKLPEGTRCEVISNELIFSGEVTYMETYKNFISETPLNALEVYRMLPEGTRCEVIFNELIMSPSPTSLHQLILSDLHALLYIFLKDTGRGKLVPSPIDVYLENNISVVQPDLIILLKENENKIKEDGIYGPPDIIIEILSTNRAYDTKRKKALYEKVGVKEYFMIDPKNKETTLLTLNNQGLYEQTYKKEALFNSKILTCIFSF